MNKLQRHKMWLGQKKIGEKAKRDYSMWVFGEWFGKRCCDNSMYLANYLCTTREELKLYWIAKEEADLSRLNPNIRIVLMDSEEAVSLLLQAGVFIVNQGVVDLTNKYNYYIVGSIFVNLWHGVAWKKIALDTLNLVQKFYYRYMEQMYNVTYYLAQSDHQAKINCRAFAINNQKNLHAGSPRNSVFYNSENKCNAYDLLSEVLYENYKLTFDNNELKIITYMPTFRDNKNNTFSFDLIRNNVKLQNILKKFNAIIIQKAHFVNSERGEKIEDNQNYRIFNLNDFPAQELLLCSDILVTDYSSCFIDFLLKDCPIIHYIYDYEYYEKKDRGLYCDKEDILCGIECMDADSLIDAIERSLNNPNEFRNLREIRRTQLLNYETDNSCEVIYSAIQAKINEIKN